MSETVNGPWRWVCNEADGGRIKELSWRRRELLTRPPASFRAPPADYGQYEQRPVFGYDDCLPTVDPCDDLPDHGEVCWLPARRRGPATQTVCHRRPLVFSRRLAAAGNVLRWNFSVRNTGSVPVGFMHVMHALMPVDRLQTLELPEFDNAVNEANGLPVPEPLSWLQPDCAHMLLLRGLREGRVGIRRRDRIRLWIDFPVHLFPTLGIWWNAGAYPAEDGCRRREFAVEPIPGTWSALDRTLDDGGGLVAEPGESIDWTVTWTIEEMVGG